MTLSLTPSSDNRTVELLQITDTHLFNDIDAQLLGIPTYKTYKNIIDFIVAKNKKYDLIVCSGDITQDQSEGSYQHFINEINRLNSPVVWLPGNHDAQEHMFKQLIIPPIHQAKHVSLNNQWQCILLDSQISGSPKGHINTQQLDFLEKKLVENPNKNTLVFIHHNPTPCGSAWLDQHKLENSEELASILNQHQFIKGVICGHIHQEIETSWQQWPFYATPSTSIQFLPNSESFSLDLQYPGFREFSLHLNGSLSSCVTRVKSDHYHIDKKAKGY